ncbi:glucose 1-dehydrogenase [Umezawaea sp. Da 62-37]|uniref:glucose 1-dehydrogenase n=1 Tax=Umezawaea sp. Da 62-37 TaxID=3075927 RepID=UPI0028F717F1|nr:glucose 1-dehydrogenase [Umezawaea sp. Da 62-37]WNV91194.1 glucose 1-dehydrogenase [Umezawaea sp. Da 62-37]
MKAAYAVPGKPEQAEVVEWDEPVPADGEVLVEGLLVGMCGTDVEIVRDGFGTPPPGKSGFVLFHESLGRVLAAPMGGDLAPGDLIAGVVRRPDTAPCPACAEDAWDFCHNGGYTERGIKELDGYGMQRWTVPPKFAVKLDPALGDLGVLTEPGSVVAKAWDQVLLNCRRAHLVPRTVMITGAGPIGLLAAMLAVQRGLTAHVVDRATSGRKPDLVRGLGATYHSSVDTVPEVDVAIECTGVAELVWESVRRAAVTALTGLSGDTGTFAADRIVLDEIVLHNRAVVGSVNAGLGDYRTAADALAAADRTWLGGLITRRVPLDSFTDALERKPDDVKVVVDLA